MSDRVRLESMFTNHYSLNDQKFKQVKFMNLTSIHSQGTSLSLHTNRVYSSACLPSSHIPFSPRDGAPSAP